MKYLASALLAIAALWPAQEKQTFTGVIADSECGAAGHVESIAASK